MAWTRPTEGSTAEAVWQGVQEVQMDADIEGLDYRRLTKSLVYTWFLHLEECVDIASRASALESAPQVSVHGGLPMLKGDKPYLATYLEGSGVDLTCWVQLTPDPERYGAEQRTMTSRIYKPYGEPVPGLRKEGVWFWLK